jgi:hypothetical protein
LLPTTSSQLLAQIFYQGVLSTLSLNVPALVDDWLHCPSTKHVNNMPISTIIQKKKKKKKKKSLPRSQAFQHQNGYLN